MKAQPTGGGADVDGEVFAYGFDAMGQPTTMTSNGGGATNWISGVTYNHLGMPTAITAGNSQVAGETRAYNELGQLKQIVSGAYRFDYNFSATANDGRITSQTAFLNGSSQETVTYSYDSLNRMTNAIGGGGTRRTSTTGLQIYRCYSGRDGPIGDEHHRELREQPGEWLEL